MTLLIKLELTILCDVERVVVDTDKSNADLACIVEGVSLTCFNSFSSAVSSTNIVTLSDQQNASIRNSPTNVHLQ